MIYKFDSSGIRMTLPSGIIEAHSIPRRMIMMDLDLVIGWLAWGNILTWIPTPRRGELPWRYRSEERDTPDILTYVLRVLLLNI